MNSYTITVDKIYYGMYEKYRVVAENEDDAIHKLTQYMDKYIEYMKNEEEDFLPERYEWKIISAYGCGKYEFQEVEQIGEEFYC